MSDFAASIVIPGDVPPVGPSPAPASPNRGGRPKGRKTDPAKLAARRERERRQYHERKAAAGGEQAPRADPVARLTGIEPPGPGRPSKVVTESRVLTDQLQAAYELLGMNMQMLGFVAGPRFTAIGVAVHDQANACAASIVKYSESNERVRNLLRKAGEGAGLLGIAMAHAPILMAATGRHDKAPVAEGDAPTMADMLAEGMRQMGDPTSDLSAVMNGMFGPQPVPDAGE